eukprot:TRINITY_DN64498_c0_g1_i1.p1 TRINITY_DN64498_c0_g1~~TRINITY_DN64498_c0_g1_i1.p1  ORF type:complete len:254 (-),score=49.58 TRINITY_DN64498_c0_g1_i1:98-754(-)
MLAECILFFFREAETTLDFVYTENHWNVNSEFLLKRLYFQVKTEAKLNESPLLAQHEERLEAFAPVQKYQGYDLKRLLEEGVVTFKTVVPEARCGLCGNPMSQPFCAQTGQPHVAQPPLQPNGGLHSHDPFAGIVDFSSTLPDLTYGMPAAEIPGYRARLHEDVARDAKQFLGDYFDDSLERMQSIDAEAQRYADKYNELKRVQSALSAARASLGSSS